MTQVDNEFEIGERMRDVHTAMKIDSEGSTEKSDRLIEAARKRKDWVLRSGEDILNGKKCGVPVPGLQAEPLMTRFDEA